MIQRPLILLLSAVLLAAFFQGCKKKAIETTMVTSANGLVLREGPEAASNKIMVIPNRSTVEILSYSNSVSVINEKTAPWAEVRYHEKEGWVFSAYLANYAPPEFEDKSKLAAFAWSPFKRKLFSEAIGAGIKNSILKNLPGKKEVTSVDQENRHNPDTIDRHHTITSQGLTVTIYEAVKLNKEIIESITITGNTLSLQYNLAVGMEKADVVKIFGDPQETKNGEIVYFTRDSIPVTVIFTLKESKLAKILIAYPVE